MLRNILFNFLGVLALFNCSINAQAFAPQEVGIVLMHGKWGAPPGPLAGNFEDEGFRVVSPVMPWSRLRNYDASYEQAVEDLHSQVQKLREDGAKMVILGGHSFGANGVLAYLSKYQDVDGAMMFAPGHTPERLYQRGLTTNAVDEARNLNAQGKGGDSFSFTDYNQTRRRQLSATVGIYLSYFDPNGLANMPQSESLVTKSIPVLCVMSINEQVLGKEYIYLKLPANPLSVYIESAAPHMEAPEATASDAAAFVKSIISP